MNFNIKLFSVLSISVFKKKMLWHILVHTKKYTNHIWQLYEQVFECLLELFTKSFNCPTFVWIHEWRDEEKEFQPWTGAITANTTALQEPLSFSLILLPLGRQGVIESPKKIPVKAQRSLNKVTSFTYPSSSCRPSMSAQFTQHHIWCMVNITLLCRILIKNLTP